MAIPTYSAGRKVIEEIANQIRPAIRNWPIVATQAVVAVKRKIPFGATNRFMQDPDSWVKGSDPLGLRSLGHEIGRVFDAYSRISKIDETLESWKLDLTQTKGCTDPLRLASAAGMGELAIINGAGNCQYQGAAVFEVLRVAGVRPVDLIYIFRGEKPRHAVPVIGIPKAPWQNVPDYGLWRDGAILADVWETNMSEPAVALAKRYPLAEHKYISYARAE